MINVEKLEAIIGYKFKNKKYLVTALTHSSYANHCGGNDYEKLEFLGDSLLEAIVSINLFDHKNLNVGELSKIRASLVSANSLSNIILKNGINEFIILGNSIKKKSLSKKILSDVFESILAAIYLDGGINMARLFVQKFLMSDNYNLDFEKVDYKTLLQEKVKGANSKSVISYVVENVDGPSHKPMFTMKLMIDKNVISTGVAGSKKDAEQICAHLALQKIK